MPVGGLFTDDARNVGGRTQIITRQWQHEQRVAAAKPAIFVPTRRKHSRAQAKRDTIRSACEPPVDVITKCSDVVHHDQQQQQRSVGDISSSRPRAQEESKSGPGRKSKSQRKNRGSTSSRSETKDGNGSTRSSRSDSSDEGAGSKRGDADEKTNGSSSSGSDDDGDDGNRGAQAIVAIVGDMQQRARNRPRRPDHVMEISDWRGIRVDHSDDSGNDDSGNDDDGDGDDNGPRGGHELITVGSYVRLAPDVDTFGCLNFGDRGIVTRIVSSRNASVPHKPHKAQACVVVCVSTAISIDG
jgi:hypothetical protein